MAVQPLTTFIGESLFTFVEWAWPRVAPRVEKIAEHVADAVRPDPPMTIRTLDDQILTGILVVDRGQVLAFLGTRTPAQTTLPRGHRYPDARPSYDDEPLWARDFDPYRR